MGGADEPAKETKTVWPERERGVLRRLGIVGVVERTEESLRNGFCLY